MRNDAILPEELCPYSPGRQEQFLQESLRLNPDVQY